MSALPLVAASHRDERNTGQNVQTRKTLFTHNAQDSGAEDEEEHDEGLHGHNVQPQLLPQSAPGCTGAV